MSTSVPSTPDRSKSTALSPTAVVSSWVSGEAAKAQFAAALPKSLTPEFYTRALLNAVTRNPDLAKCTRESFIKCAMDLSAAGLTPDGRRAHLIARWNSKKSHYECTYIIDYKGLCELVVNSGWICNAEKVCENDFFEIRDMMCRHGIDPRRPRGPVIGYWAMMKHPDGREIHEWVSSEEVKKIYDRFHSDDGFSPWKTDYDEMGKKTALRRITKKAKLSAEASQVIDAEYERVDRTVKVVAAKSMSDALADHLSGHIEAAAEPEPVVEAEVAKPVVEVESLPDFYAKSWWTERIRQKGSAEELLSLLADLDANPDVPADTRKFAATQIDVAVRAMKAKK